MPSSLPLCSIAGPFFLYLALSLHGKKVKQQPRAVLARKDGTLARAANFLFAVPICANLLLPADSALVLAPAIC